LPFCQICPGKSLLPLFEGQTRYLTIEMTNAVTIFLSVALTAGSGFMVAGMFFRERFFCIFCPMLALFNILKPLAVVRIVKIPKFCSGCGACSRLCPMDIDELSQERIDGNKQRGECLGCGTCVEACAAEGCLHLAVLGRPLLSSSPALARGEKKRP
jgi:polyferredoxin